MIERLRSTPSEMSYFKITCFGPAALFFVLFRVGTITTNLDEEKGDHRVDDVSCHLFFAISSYFCETAQCMANYTVDSRIFGASNYSNLPITSRIFFQSLGKHSRQNLPSSF